MVNILKNSSGEFMSIFAEGKHPADVLADRLNYI
jgi:hypothetical protein